MVVHCCDISNDGQTIISSSFDHTIKCWSIKTGAEILTLKGHESSVFACAYSPSNKLIASASFDKVTNTLFSSNLQTAKLWNATTGAEIVTMRGHTSKVTDCCFSSDGKLLATSSGVNT
jgi:WD40 repeat protein